MHRRTLMTVALLVGWAGLAAAQTPDAEGTPAAPAAKQVRKSAQIEEQSQATVAAGTGRRFVDADGNGVCDTCNGLGRGGTRAAARGNQGRGPGDGTGNQGVGPRDGSGRGARTGACDGSGPKGRGRRGGRRR